MELALKDPDKALRQEIENLKSTGKATVADLNQRLEGAAFEKDALENSFKDQDTALREEIDGACTPRILIDHRAEIGFRIVEKIMVFAEEGYSGC